MIFAINIQTKPSQMKKLSIIIVFLALLLSCEKNGNTCNCNDPLTDLAWLQEVKNSFTNCSCEMSIIQATYNKQTVFYSAMTDLLCDGYYPIVLRDCDGNFVKSYEPGDQAKDTEIAKMKILYRCKTK
jgi:hypothetical protein